MGNKEGGSDQATQHYSSHEATGGMAFVLAHRTEGRGSGETGKRVQWEQEGCGPQSRPVGGNNSLIHPLPTANKPH